MKKVATMDVELTVEERNLLSGNGTRILCSVPFYACAEVLSMFLSLSHVSLSAIDGDLTPRITSFAAHSRLQERNRSSTGILEDYLFHRTERGIEERSKTSRRSNEGVSLKGNAPHNKANTYKSRAGPK